MIAKAKSTLRRLLPKNDFARGVSVLVGGTAGAQLLTVLASPLLTRLYTPADFGLLAVYASLLALINVISSLRYELAIPLAEDDAEAANVAALSLILVVLSTLLSGVLVWLLGSAIAEALGVPALVDYLWLLPVGVLLGGAYNVFNYWSVRTKRFTTIAGTRLRQALVTIAIKLAAFKLGGIALLYAQVAGASVGTTSLARPALASAGFRQVSWRGIAKAAGRYRRFPYFSTWAGFANTAGLQLPPIMLAALFGPAASGLFSLAYRVLTLPLSLIGGAIGQVFFSNAAEAHRKGQLAPLVVSLHAKLALIGMPPALILILLGPELFAFVFGAPWRQAGEFACWLAPWLYLVFVTSPLSTVSTVTERQKQGLIYHAIQLISRVIAIAIGGWIGNLPTTIALYAIVSCLTRLGYLFWLTHISGNSVREIQRQTLSAFGFALFAVLPILLGLIVVEFSPLVWVIALLITASIISLRYWFLLREAY